MWKWIVGVGVIVVAVVLGSFLLIEHIDPHNDFCTRATNGAECATVLPQPSTTGP